MKNKEENQNKEATHFIKYKWLYLWIVAVAAIVFGLLMMFLKDFGQSVIYIITGFALLIFVGIRFIPLIKSTRDKWAVVINTAELLIDLSIAVLTLIFVFKGDTEGLYSFYPFMLGGVLYLRGFVYFVEVVFFNTKVVTSKFFLHLLLITVGTVIIARFDNYTVDALRWLFALAFTISGVVAAVDGGFSFGKYKRIYSNDNKKKELPKEEGYELPESDNKKYDDNEKKIPEVPIIEDNDSTNIVA